MTSPYAVITPRIQSGRYGNGGRVVSGRPTISRGSMTASTSGRDAGSALGSSRSPSGATRNFRVPRPSDARNPGGLFNTRGVVDAEDASAKGLTLFGEGAEDLTGLKSLRSFNSARGISGAGGSSRPQTSNGRGSSDSLFGRRPGDFTGNGGGGGDTWARSTGPGTIGVGGVAAAKSVYGSGRIVPRSGTRCTDGTRPSTSSGGGGGVGTSRASHRTRIASARTYSAQTPSSTARGPRTSTGGVARVRYKPPDLTKFEPMSSPHELLIKEALENDGAVYAAEIAALAEEYNDTHALAERRAGTLHRLEMEMLETDQLADMVNDLLGEEGDVQRDLEIARAKVQDMNSQMEMMHMSNDSMQHVLNRMRKEHMVRGKEVKKMQGVVRDLMLDAAELNRSCKVARSEGNKAMKRHQLIAQKCESKRRRNKAELDGLKRVHAAHLFLRKERENWHERRATESAAREAQEAMLQELAEEAAREFAKAADQENKMWEERYMELEEFFTSLREITGIEDPDKIVETLTKWKDPVYAAMMEATKDESEKRAAALTRKLAEHKRELSEISITGVSSSSRDTDKLTVPLAEATKRMEREGTKMQEATAVIMKCKAWSEHKLQKLAFVMPDPKADKLAADMLRRVETGGNGDVGVSIEGAVVSRGASKGGVHTAPTMDALGMLSVLEFRLGRMLEAAQGNQGDGVVTYGHMPNSAESNVMAEDSEDLEEASEAEAEAYPPLSPESSTRPHSPASHQKVFGVRAPRSRVSSEKLHAVINSHNERNAHNLRVDDPSIAILQEEASILALEDSFMSDGSGTYATDAIARSAAADVSAAAAAVTGKTNDPVGWGEGTVGGGFPSWVPAEAGEDEHPDVDFRRINRSAQVVSRKTLKGNSEYLVRKAGRVSDVSTPPKHGRAASRMKRSQSRGVMTGAQSGIERPSLR